jgi:ribosomal protein S20
VSGDHLTTRSREVRTLAKTPRTWTGARTPSGLKRVRQAERRHAILQPRRTAAKTFVAKALDVATHQADPATAAIALAEAHAALDRAAKTGAIHANAAARRKSRLTLKFNAATGGAQVQTSTRVTKTTSKAQAAKAAKSRIAASKADKAKGAQTAAGKARAALSKTARADAAAKAAAAASGTATTAAAPAKAAPKKAATASKAKATTKAAPKPKASAKAAAPKSTAKKAPAKK